jgi:hypothetical protein
MSVTPSSPRRRNQKIGPERVLVGGIIVLYGFLVRAVGKLFGVTGDGSALLTLVIIGSAIRGVRRALAAPGKQFRKARKSPHLGGNSFIATAGLKTTVDGIAGPPSAGTSFAAGLIVLAVVTHSLRPGAVAVQKSVRAVITKGLQLRRWFAARGSMISARVRESSVVPGASTDR